MDIIKQIPLFAKKLVSSPQGSLNNFSSDELKSVGLKALDKAKNCYDPRVHALVGDFSNYLRYWVYDEMRRFVARKSLHEAISPKVKKIYSDPYSQSLNYYFSILSPEKMIDLEHSIFLGTYKERQKKYYQNKKILDNLRPLFKDILIAASIYSEKFLKRQGHREVIMEYNGISNNDLKIFLSNTDSLIRFLNMESHKVTNASMLYWSRYFLPCFLCQNKDLDIETPTQMLNFMISRYPILKKAKDKIDIIYRPDLEKIDSALTNYSIEEDRFTIKLFQKPKAHMIVTVTHELGHVISYLSRFSKNENPLELSGLQLETEAAEITHETLRNISEKLWQSSLIEVLHTFWRTLFLLEAFQNPNQDLDRVYAKTYNQCFLHGNQKSNPFYLINWQIVGSPLRSLVYAIAETKALIKTLPAELRLELQNDD